MKNYSIQELNKCLDNLDITQGDIVFIFSNFTPFGKLVEAKTKEEMCELIFSSIKRKIGDEGTIVLPTYTPIIGSTLNDYFHENTKTNSGILSDYVMSLDNSIRSLHPIFSVTANGPKAKQICENISTSGFGIESPLHRLFALKAKSISIGYPLYSGKIIAGIHCIETLYGVPYYYNKIVKAGLYQASSIKVAELSKILENTQRFINIALIIFKCFSFYS